MGLDAFVYCNCYETGSVRSTPPNEEIVFVSPDGSLDCSDEGNDELYFAFARWLQNACEHKDGILLHRRIGNIALVGLLRSELGSQPESFPILLGAVLYNGTHGGDYLDQKTIQKLEPELDALAGVHSDKPETERFLREFEEQMRELVSTSRQVNKPIAF